MRKASIKSVEVYLPDNVVCNEQIEGRIRYADSTIEAGVLGRLTGIKTRRFAGEDVQVSDLACEAARKVIETNQDVKIDLLIFAAASSDLIEPATANIVQIKLGLKCPVMDIKNACNSFVSAIHTASAFVEAGIYRNVLIVCGEKLSEVINYTPRDYEHLMKCLAGYSLGDAGAAMLIGHDEGCRIVYQNFSSWGQYWNLSTVKGGGSLAYRDFDKYYFECDSREMKTAFLCLGAGFFSACMTASGWNRDDITCVVSHQISGNTTSLVSECIGVDESKFVNTFATYGNNAAATIPLALHQAINQRRLEKGDKLLLLGLAAGISISVQLIEW